MDPGVTNPAGRAGTILWYASGDLIEEIVETMGKIRRENESPEDFP